MVLEKLALRSNYTKGQSDNVGGGGGWLPQTTLSAPPRLCFCLKLHGWGSESDFHALCSGLFPYI